MSNVYAITDILGYAESMRRAAADYISDNNKEDLNDYISIKQIINLVNQNCVGFDEEDRPLLDENSNEEIFEETITWIYNVGLAKLAAKGYVECAWDNDSNEMVFWAKEEKSNERTDKPKRKNRKNKG